MRLKKSSLLRALSDFALLESSGAEIFSSGSDSSKDAPSKSPMLCTCDQLDPLKGRERVAKGDFIFTCFQGMRAELHL